jgi:diaminopimelate epimerase
MSASLHIVTRQRKIGRMKILFYKYQGAGNDFIVLDGRTHSYALTQQQIAFLCHRRLGIGADGLMILREKAGVDFEMIYYNADGREGSLCGNGGRCLTRFAYDLGIRPPVYTFWAVDGMHEAFLDTQTQWIHLKMNQVSQIEIYQGDWVLNTGSPHYVQAVEEVDAIHVLEAGRAIRYSARFTQQGINVNFVQQSASALRMRTYERGVEDETLSCGTGVTAAALVFAPKQLGKHRMQVSTRGGELAVEFTRTGEHQFEHIWLCGPAVSVFEGTISLND